MYSVFAIANTFIDKAKNGEIKDLTPMKLQKLMFFAQAWHYQIFGQVLFEDNFERWQYGPVLPEIYYAFKSFGATPITEFGEDIFQQKPRHLSIEEAQQLKPFLNKIIEVYGGYTGTQLSSITHQSGTAWSLGKIGTLISVSDLRQGKL